MERLISPDRADVLPSVNHPPKRLFVAGALILLLLCCAWLVFGVVDTRIKGRCLLLSPQGVDNIASAVDGRVEGIAIRPGDSVAAGQLLATISRPEFDTRLRKAEARLAELRRRSDAAAPVIARSLRLGRNGVASEQATVAERLRTLTERQQLAAKRLQAQQTLFEQGLSTRQSLLSAQDQVDKLAIEQAGLQSRAKQLDFQAQEEQRNLNGESGQLALQVAEAERELAQLQLQQRELMQVRAPHAGTVIELKTRNGLALPAGGDIASIELANGGNGSKLPPPLSALIFVHAADGKLLQAGMSAEITPTNVKRQEFGFIRAQIGDVSAFPASREAINQRLNNPDVVKELAGDGVSTQIQSALLRRPDGNYAWSGAARQPPDVRSGSMCSAEIVVREQHPIEFVWPLIKKLTGTS
ncbi:NHLP bacteriocin system secretion protein [Duganella sp. LjRoot269]|uniref:NHLP bacteriocin system secretion protein n=1 Tax=Duganella sp. LjRoot269 TaxID=3342305 RepID=UPI003ED0CB45